MVSYSRRKSWLLPVSFVASVLGHLFVLFGILFVTPIAVPPSEPVTIFDKDHMADIDLEPNSGKPVVNSEDTGNHKAPSADAYWGQRNQTAPKESKAKLGPAFQAAERESKSGGRQKSTPPPPLSMTDLAIDSQPRGRWSLGEGESFEGTTSSDSFSNDYLPEVSFGARTLLSTREYEFFTYIERIRQAVAPVWHEDVQRRVDVLWTTGRALNIGEDLITKLVINLDSGGNVTEVAVLRSSGSRTIDHAGESAFRRMQVFPNPPKGLIGAGGVITLRWVFVLRVTPAIAHVNFEQPLDEGQERYIR